MRENLKRSGTHEKLLEASCGYAMVKFAMTTALFDRIAVLKFRSRLTEKTPPYTFALEEAAGPVRVRYMEE